jgi:hypothetical protein
MFTSVTAPGYRASAATGWTSTYYELTMTAQSRPTVTTPTSVNIATTTATLGGTVTAAGDTSLSAVGVVYAPTATNANPQLNGTSVTNLTSSAATGVMALSATGLTAGTGYSYAAYATNSVGTTYATVSAITTGPVPTLTFATPTAATVVYGATLSNVATSTLSGGSYGAISYTSSAPSIATIDATTGLVTTVGAGTTTITATQAVAAGYNDTGSQTYVLTVGKGTPTLTSGSSATSITYGQTLASATLSGGAASVVGAFAFTTPSTAPNAGTAAQGVTFTPTDTANYNNVTTTVSVTVAKATPTISVAPTASGITYGQTLASSTLSSGTASVAGTFTFATTSTAPNAGTAAQGGTFTPSDTTNYNATTTTVNVTVAKATPTVTWATPSSITYGTALSATQLNASGSVDGAIVYSPASGTTPSAGTQTLTATFTPTDTTNYNSVAATTVSLTVNKATPTITWATPSAITYGTPLSATQLNASSGSLGGTFTYSPVSGTTLGAGTQTLSVGFVPDDTTNYNSAAATTVSLTVNKATPTITWATPSAITYGTALSATQLNASSGSVGGTFTYSPASGSTPTAGSQTLSVGFVPTDAANYNSVAATTVSLTVNKAAATVTLGGLSATYDGRSKSATATTNPGSLTVGLTYDGSATAPTNAGSYAVVGTISDANYQGSASSTFVIAKATPTITWAIPSAITYGTALSAAQLNASSGSLGGTFTYSPASGSTPTAGTQTLSVGFVPTDAANYNSVAATTVSLTVKKATPTITWATPSAITYGTALSATQLNASSGSLGGTFTYSPASGTTLGAGTQTLSVGFVPTDAANYNSVAATTVSLTVNKATPTITWATPSAISYGTALSATQLNASSGGLAGTFTYSPVSGTTPIAGTQTLSVGFVPDDAANYNSVAATTVSLTVNKAAATVTLGGLSATYDGSSKSATATTNPGSLTVGLTYDGSATAPTNAGSYAVVGTISDANYQGSASSTFVIAKATPTITWATPSAITYGTALSATQLNASSGSLGGTFTYSPVSGTTLGAGTQTLSVGFVPDDTTNYNSVAATTVSLTVNKATPTITWATPSAITYGTALSATQLNASSGSLGGSITYSPASGAILSVGTQTLNATFTPTDTANYNPASASVALSVAVAVPGSPTAIAVTTANGEATVTFTAPSNPGSSAITGFTIRATAADGSIVTVNATGSPAKVTGLTPGKSYRFTVTANNSAGSSESSTTSDALTISLVNQTISFAAPADRVSNSGSFALSATASSGLPVTFNLVSGPGLLAGNVVDLTGATGTIELRASQAGNATYAAAPAVEVSFAVTAGRTNVVFGQAFRSDSRVPAAELGLVLPGNGQPGSLLVVSTLIPGLNGVITLGPTVSGGFIGTLVSSVAAAPLDARIQAALVTYTITGTLLNGVLTGTIAPLGLVFTAPVPLPTGPSAAVAGLYVTSALVQVHGAVSVVVGANNDVLVLLQSATVTTGGLTTLQPDTTFALAAPGNGLITGAVNSVTTAATATLTLPGTVPVVFLGLSSTTVRTDRLIGLASRAKVGTGESVLITGVAIGGTESKRVLIRAGGPALAAFGLANTLPNPTLKIYRGSTLIAQNDDWNPADAAEMARLGLFAFPTGSKDAAILTTLEPGGYTAHISDLSGTGTGVALAEIYDASVNPTAEYQRLVSIASRGTVTVGDGALIGGFVVVGNSPKTLLIRGIGPTLTGFGLVAALADPVLTIYQDGEAIATNAGWANSAAIATAATQAGAFALAAGSRDAALLVTLKPGSYTAQVKATQSASSGVALIEIYEVP